MNDGEVDRKTRIKAAVYSGLSRRGTRCDLVAADEYCIRCDYPRGCRWSGRLCIRKNCAPLANGSLGAQMRRGTADLIPWLDQSPTCASRCLRPPIAVPTELHAGRGPSVVRLDGQRDLLLLRQPAVRHKPMVAKRADACDAFIVPVVVHKRHVSLLG